MSDTRKIHPAIEAFLHMKSYTVDNSLNTIWSNLNTIRSKKYSMQVLSEDGYAIMIYSPDTREVLFRIRHKYAGYIDATTEFVPFIVERLVMQDKLDSYVSINIIENAHNMRIINSSGTSLSKVYIMKPAVWYSVSLMGTVFYMDDTGYLSNILADIDCTEMIPQMKPVQITFQSAIMSLI